VGRPGINKKKGGNSVGNYLKKIGAENLQSGQIFMETIEAFWEKKSVWTRSKGTKWDTSRKGRHLKNEGERDELAVKRETIRGSSKMLKNF